MRRLKDFMDGLPQFYVLLFGLAWVAASRALDRSVGPSPANACAYVIPISLVAWYVGGLWVVVISVFAAIAALHADLASKDIFREPYYPYWTALARFICYLVISHLLVLCKSRASASEKKNSGCAAGSDRYGSVVE